METQSKDTTSVVPIERLVLNQDGTACPPSNPKIDALNPVAATTVATHINFVWIVRLQSTETKGQTNLAGGYGINLKRLSRIRAQFSSLR